MLLKSPWKSISSDSPSKIDGASTLSRGLVFAYSGHHGMDLVSGIRPTNTAVAESTKANRRAWSFSGGAAGASDLNFGAITATADLHEQPATWAFYCTAASATTTCLACHTDVNVDRGWQIGGVNGTLGLAFVRASTNLRKTITNTVPANTPFTFVVTSNGLGLASGVSIYLNAVIGAPNSAQDAAGATGAATAQNLYLGRRRFDTAGSHSGDIFVGLIANRAWTDAEVRLFHNNPYRAFVTPPATVYSFGIPSANSNISGDSAITFGSTATLVAPGTMATSTAVAAATVAALTGAGTLAGSDSIIFSALLENRIYLQSSINFSTSAILVGIGSVAGTNNITFDSSAVLGLLIGGSSTITVGQTGTLLASGTLAASSNIAISSSLQSAALLAAAATAQVSFGASMVLSFGRAIAGSARLSVGTNTTLGIKINYVTSITDLDIINTNQLSATLVITNRLTVGEV